MRTIGVITTSRADYGYYLPILRKIQSDPELNLHLMVTGMHLSPEFGLTARVIEQDGFDISERVEMLVSSDTPESIAKSMGLGTIGFAQAFGRFRPDILLVLGDRFEMHAAVSAALPFNIPVAHIAGGESTEGLIDEAIRHSLTKMSHLHFASTEYYAQRVIQMGEEPWRVIVSGSPTLDNLGTFPLHSWQELQSQFGIDLAGPALLVTFHPVTLSYEHTGEYMTALLAALAEVDFDIVFTYPNADTQGRLIIEMVQDFSAQNPRTCVATNLGQQGYFSLLSHVAAMVGNSSSGIVESASFNLPVVDIGHRQKGRVRGENVINVGYSQAEIKKGIETAVSAKFRASIAGLTNLHGDGHAAGRIVDRLKAVPLDDQLLQKRFHVIQEVA